MNPLLDFDIPWDVIDCNWWGYVLEFFALTYAFIGLSIVCDDHMVPALETLCHRWKIGDDVAGATFMAFGSAAPEIIINVVATIQNAADTEGDSEATSLGVSAIIGSGMVAFSLIPAACGLFAPGDLSLKRRPLFRDEFFYLTSMCILVFIMFDDVVHSWEAALLVLNYTIYLLVVVFGHSVRVWYVEKVLNMPYRSQIDLDNLIAEEQIAVPVGTTGSGGNQWREVLAEMGFSDFIKPFEEQDFTDMQDWKDITVQNFHEMGVRQRKSIAKFRQFLTSPNFKAMIQEPAPIRKLSIHSQLSALHDENEEAGTFEKIFEFVAAPCYTAFEYTCPDCEVGKPMESYYLVTFFVALIWVSLMSFTLASVVQRWVLLSGVPMVFFGLILVSLGAEIPDTIASVSISKKGYGSMAVANCQGTQVINICIGLGMPWLLTAVAGAQNKVNQHLVVPAAFQVCLIMTNMSLLLGHALCCGLQKAVLNRTKSYALIATYFTAIIGFGVYLHSEGEL